MVARSLRVKRWRFCRLAHSLHDAPTVLVGVHLHVSAEASAIPELPAPRSDAGSGTSRPERDSTSHPEPVGGLPGRLLWRLTASSSAGPDGRGARVHVSSPGPSLLTVASRARSSRSWSQTKRLIRVRSSDSTERKRTPIAKPPPSDFWLCTTCAIASTVP